MTPLQAHAIIELSLQSSPTISHRPTKTWTATDTCHVTRLEFDVVDVHNPASQICEFEGVDVIIKIPSFAVCSNQTWGGNLHSFRDRRNL